MYVRRHLPAYRKQASWEHLTPLLWHIPMASHQFCYEEGGRLRFRKPIFQPNMVFHCPIL